MSKILSLLMLVVNCSLLEAQNVGLGTSTPEYKLDIAGSARMHHNTQTAGIYLDGTTLPTRSFIGMMNADYVGIWGAGSGWSFVMNANNGNVGIGTPTPTTRLDVNGGFRLRPNFPNLGAVLTSVDYAGNAQWVKTVAFGVSGNNDLATFTFANNNTWNKVIFSSIADYNAGFAWQPVNQVFVAPVKGVYHFGVHLHHTLAPSAPKVRLVRRRGNVDTQVFYVESILSAGGYTKANSRPYDASVELLLEPSDQIWVEVNAGYLNPATFFGDKKLLSFNGRLVTIQ